MMSSSSSSSSSSSRWSRLALFAAVPTVVAAATAYLYSQYQTEQKELAERKRAPKGKKGKKGTNSTAAPSSSSSPLDSGILLSPAQAAALAALDDSIPAEFATEQEFVLALHQDVELRARDRANPKLERRIWYAIRKIDPTPSSISSMSHTARTEIGQWIVAYHANATPLLDGTENPSIKPTAGGPAGTSHTKYLRVALDYDLAWALLESVETELSKIEKRTDEQEELRKSTELVLLDLAHKMRNAERMLSLYKRIRGRNTNVDADTGRLDPQQFTEMEFFTLWMLSPLLGQWYDFKDWSDFMDSKGQSLDEFHHLATQRPDLIDFRQMYRMVNQAAEQGRVIGWDTEKKTKEEEETKAKDESAKTEEKPKEGESTEVSESSTEKNESESTTETATEAEKESSNTETKTETETETSSESTDKPTDSESSTAADTTSTSSSSATPAAAAAAAPPTGPVIIPPSCTSSTIPSPSLLWDHPDSSELRWSNWDIVGTVWKFIASSGDDEDAIKQYVDSHRPENEWKSIAVGAVGFKKIGACARIQSMISSAVPICGPLLVAKDGTNATVADESSSTADHADGASSSESTNSSSSSSSGSFTPFVFHGTGSVHFRAEIPAKTKGAPPQRRLLKLCEEYRDFKLLKDEEAKELLKKYRVKKNKKTTDDEKEKSTTADDASSTEPSEATATAESTAAASEAAVAVAAEDEFDNSDLTVEEYDPSNPPQLWRGVYIFEQYSVEEALVQHPVTGRILGTRHLPAAKPFMHVEHELIIKMTETVRAQ